MALELRPMEYARSRSTSGYDAFSGGFLFLPMSSTLSQVRTSCITLGSLLTFDNALWLTLQRSSGSTASLPLSLLHRHTVAPLGIFANPDAWFDHVHIDLVGPLPPPMVLCICSPALTASRGSQRLYPSWTVLPTWWPKHVFRHGFLDLVYPPLSPQTAEDSSNQTCGRPLFSYLVLNTYAQLLTTPSPMDLSSGSTDTLINLKASPQPEHWTNTLPLVLLGIHTHSSKTSALLQQSWSTAPVFASLVNSSARMMLVLMTSQATFTS